MARLAVVIPVLCDSDALGRLLAEAQPHPDIELVVVDGGADDSLRTRVAGWPAARVIQSPAGRGVQMNAGAAATSAPLLLFLHADSRLPRGWAEPILALPERYVGGWFRFALDDDAWQARVIERLVALRVRLFRLPYGDQGLFVRRDVFERLGGFKPWPLMEDVELVRRLVAAGPVCELPLPLRTASRRWRRDGWFRRSAGNLGLLSLYFAGVSPARLARWYAGRRDRRRSP